MGRGSSQIARGRWKRPLIALAGAAAAIAVMAPAAHANFTTTKCLGSNITGRGASFQAGAQAGWKTDFETNFCDDVGVFPTVTYEPQGSGAGRRAMGERTAPNADGSQSRNQVPRFGATDEAPTATGVSQMNQGTDSAGDEGTIHVIPLAVGAVAPPVNWPNNCDRALLPDANETNPASANSAPFVDRVRFTRAQLEEIWNGDSAHDQWSEIFPTLAGDADCTGFITRVVRFDDSGTTFAWKDYLDHINSGRGWKTTYITGPDTRNWPNASLAPRADCAGSPTGPTGTHLTSGCANGNGSLVQKLLATDGSIGYSDIATARSNGLAITPAATIGSRDDDVFWTQAQNPSNAYTEPTADDNGFRTDGLKGADCTTTQFTAVPASTLGDWFPTSGVDSATGYVVCTLTYGLAWDDYKPPYSLQGCGTACEEQKARSVKDYLASIISDSGQETLFTNDYAPLPDAILNIARTGINAVCWDKPGGTCPVVRYLYPRPISATPLFASLVVAYNACGSSTGVHAPPLNSGSCNPAVQSSNFLTVGSPDANARAANGSGSVRYKVLVGNPATPADEANVDLLSTITDVRNRDAGLTDYTGQVQVNQTVRITDRSNGTSQGQGGTVEDIEFPITAACAATGDTTVGGTCSVSTTFDALMPNVIKENKRAIWELSQVVINDGGADGVASTTPNTEFMRQGVFAP